MSKRFRPIHAGPPLNSSSFRSYAILINRRTFTPLAVKRPPGRKWMFRVGLSGGLLLTTETAYTGWSASVAFASGVWANVILAVADSTTKQKSVLHTPCEVLWLFNWLLPPTSVLRRIS